MNQPRHTREAQRTRRSQETYNKQPSASSRAASQPRSTAHSEQAPRRTAPQQTARTPASARTAPPRPRMAQPPKRKAPKKRRRGLRVAIIVAAVLLVLLSIPYFIFQHLYGLMNTDTSALNLSQVFDASLLEEDESVDPDAIATTDAEADDIKKQLLQNAQSNTDSIVYNDNVFSVLLLGNDSRNAKTNERTDSMILVSINKQTKQIVLTSFLRDLYVYIPGWDGYQRLNAANVFGGPEMTINTIEQNFGVSIDSYAAIDFVGFTNVIDALGGVDIYLSSSEVTQINKTSFIGYGEGEYHLNGTQALAYCRIRNIDSDFGRTNRQRNTLMAIWDAAKNASLLDLYSMMTSVLSEVTTDLTQSECTSLLVEVAKMRDYELVTQYAPADGTYDMRMVDGMSVLVADLAENKNLLHETIYE